MGCTFLGETQRAVTRYRSKIVEDGRRESEATERAHSNRRFVLNLLDRGLLEVIKTIV